MNKSYVKYIDQTNLDENKINLLLNYYKVTRIFNSF